MTNQGALMPNSVLFRPVTEIKGVSRINPADGVTYDRGGRIEQLLPSHDFRWQNFPAPIHGQSLQENLVHCFGALIQVYRAEGLEAVAAQCEHILGDFWRRTYYKQFPYFALPRQAPKAAKELVRLESDTWIAALDCLKAINERRGGWQFDAPYTNIGFALSMLIFEGALLTWRVDRFSDPLGLGQSAEAMRSYQQSVNRALQNGQSPFPTDIFTHSFVLACLAGEDYPNLWNAWQRLLKARSALVQHWRKHHPVAMAPDSGKIIDRKAAITQKKAITAKKTRRNLM
jgi:hypothetical protein